MWNVEKMNPKDDSGTTPLDIAAQNNDMDIFKAIFEDASNGKQPKAEILRYSN